MASDALNDALREAMGAPLLATHLTGLGDRSEGKVRDSYRRGDGTRVLVATDRVSAFDRVLGAIPYRGQVLNQLSAWWFEQTRDVVPNHLLAVPDPNVSWVREARALPVEVVVRGYVTGVTSTSLWTMVAAGVERPYGLELPRGLRKNDRLPAPVITPTTKGEAGTHDECLSREQIIMGGLVPEPLWTQVEAVALALFARGTEVAARAGLVLVDTKYELGLIDGALTLIDEIHTPDSSRYWAAADLARAQVEGREPESLDKEHLRRHLKQVGYGGEGPPPPLPEEVVLETARRYIGIYEVLTGRAFAPALLPAEDRIRQALVDFSWIREGSHVL